MIGMLVNGRNYRTVWMEDDVVKLIDQTKLPFSFEIAECKSYRDTANAIKDMIVRGAPAIGAAAAYAVAQACMEFRGSDMKTFLTFINDAAEIITSTRPTANDLFFAADYVKNSLKKTKYVEQAKKIAADASSEYADKSVESCMAIGKNGEKLLKNNARILTHCNAGWLACVDWGTATAPMYCAKRNGKEIFVFVDETRPRSQGARLTAWELLNENIEHAIIADNAAAYYMQRGDIDIVITGADRIALNGDAANKTGTLEKAIVAKEYGIPFYVAAPLTSFDAKSKAGKDIPIEERSEDEITTITGITKDNRIESVQVTNPGSKAKNPAFDVTPAKYIKGIITEKGIIKAKKNAIKKLLKR